MNRHAKEILREGGPGLADVARSRRRRRTVVQKKRLWAASDKRLVLSGIRVAPDVPIAAGADIPITLAKYWEQTFSASPHDEVAM